MFRRRGRDTDQDPGDDYAQESEDGELDDLTDEDDPDGSGRKSGTDTVRTDGPWDATELDKPGNGRIDLGGLLVPVFQDMQMRLEMSESQQVISATVVVGQSAIQLIPFAAPRTEGIWADVLDENAKEITKQGGIVDRGIGPFGPEMRARIPVKLPDGNQGMQVARFLGADGPRWFLRGIVSGQAAVQAEAAAVVEQVFRQTVVVRGDAAMAPHDPIPLKMPAQTPPDGVAAEPAEPEVPSSPYRGDLNPFERGPEITEIR
jgi:hypothetical protein